MRKLNIISFSIIGIFAAGVIALIITQNQAVVAAGPSAMDTTQDLWSGGLATATGMASILFFAFGIVFLRQKAKRKEKKVDYPKVVERDLRDKEVWGATFAYGAALYTIIIAMVFMFAF